MLLGILYCLLPTQNANIDSWYYAACVKNTSQLINSHHLLYNAFGSIWTGFLSVFYPNISVLSALNLMNACAATCSIICFYYILLQLHQSARTSMFLSLLTGLCFGFIRFATDAETYILPILFSLISSYFYFKPFKYSNLLISAIFSMLAVCTHQIHIWWSLALYIAVLYNYNYSKNAKIIYSLVLFSGLVIYFLGYLFGSNANSFLDFILGEYQKGNATIQIGFQSLILTVINCFRTIFQVHGLMFHFTLKHFLMTLIVLSIELILLILIIKHYKTIFSGTKKSKLQLRQRLFIGTFILQLLFAFISSGNAEFMAMLPFLAIAYLASTYTIQIQKPFVLILLFIGIWNVYFGLVPYHFENITQTTKQVEYTEQNKEAYFLWGNKPLIENQLNYKHGFYQTYGFITLKELDSCIAQGLTIYTDMGNTTTDFSRATITFDKTQQSLKSNYNLIKVDSFNNLYGKNYIYLFDKKNENFIFAP